MLNDHKRILHTSRQWQCRDVYKISLWSVEYILNQGMANFGRVSNSIEKWLWDGRQVIDSHGIFHLTLIAVCLPWRRPPERWETIENTNTCVCLPKSNSTLIGSVRRTPSTNSPTVIQIWLWGNSYQPCVGTFILPSLPSLKWVFLKMKALTRKTFTNKAYGNGIVTRNNVSKIYSDFWKINIVTFACGKYYRWDQLHTYIYIYINLLWKLYVMLWLEISAQTLTLIHICPLQTRT